MKLRDIEATFKEAYRKSQLGFGASLEAWAQFYGAALIELAKAARKLDGICEEVNMGDATMDDIGKAQQALTDALEELVK